MDLSADISFPSLYQARAGGGSPTAEQEKFRGWADSSKSTVSAREIWGSCTPTKEIHIEKRNDQYNLNVPLNILGGPTTLKIP